MNFVWTVIGMLAVTFGSRLLGLSLRASLPPFWQRFLHFVPIAVFAALVTPNLTGDRGEWLERLVAALLASLAAWRTRQLWVGIVGGMVVFWVLRSL